MLISVPLLSFRGEGAEGRGLQEINSYREPLSFHHYSSASFPETHPLNFIVSTCLGQPLCIKPFEPDNPWRLHLNGSSPFVFSFLWPQLPALWPFFHGDRPPLRGKLISIVARQKDLRLFSFFRYSCFRFRTSILYCGFGPFCVHIFKRKDSSEIIFSSCKYKFYARNLD